MQDRTINRIYMLTPEMNAVSGVAASLTTLAIELARRGLEVWVFVRRPVQSKNQYAQRLKAYQIELVSPPLYLGFLAKADWSVRDKILRAIVRILLPLCLPLILWDSIHQRRPLLHSWQGMSGFINRGLSPYLLPDYLDRIFYSQLNWYARTYPPDVVEVSRSDYLAGVQWARDRGFPVVYKECGAPTEWSDDQETYIKQAACVITKSQAAKQALRKLSAYAGDIVVVPNAFDDSFLGDNDLLPPGNGWSAEAGIRLIYIGRLSPEKGVQFLPDIVKQVVDNSILAELLIIGDGRLANELKQRCAELGITRHVRFLGALKHVDVLHLLPQADILLLPSLTEGLPNVVIEAMACGVTVVATTAGGTPDLVKHGVTGILTPPAKPEIMAEAIIKLSEEPAQREMMGKAAREAFVTGPWTPQAVGSCTIDIYQKAAGLTTPARIEDQPVS